MTWAKMDDGFYDHPKVAGLPRAAVGLFVVGLSWSARHETDGYIPRVKIPVLGKPDRYPFKLAAILVKAGLWEELGRDGYIARVRSSRHPAGELHRAEGDGFQIHDYLDCNPSAAELGRQRSGTRDRVKRHRDRMRGATPSAGPDSVPDGSQYAPDALPTRSRARDEDNEEQSKVTQTPEVSAAGDGGNAVTNRVTETPVTLLPTRPDPISLSTKEREGALIPKGSDSGGDEARDQTPSSVSGILDAYTSMFTSKVGAAPPIFGNGAGRIVEPVLRLYGADLTGKLLRRFFESDDPFYAQSGFTLKTFVGCVPQLLAQVNGVAKTDETRRREQTDAAYEKRMRHVLGLED